MQGSTRSSAITGTGALRTAAASCPRTTRTSRSSETRTEELEPGSSLKLFALSSTPTTDSAADASCC